MSHSHALMSYGVTHLAERRIAEVQGELRPSRLVAAWRVFKFFLQLKSHVAVQVRHSEVLKDSAIWINGLAQEMWKEDEFALSVAFDERLMAKMDALKGPLLENRESLLALRATAPVEPLTKAVDLALASAADLFDAIEACRWAALEARASKSKISSGFTASTPEELEAIFEKMSNDA